MGRKSQKPPLAIVAGSAPTSSEPPAALREAGAAAWRSIMKEYQIRDSGGLIILEQIGAAVDRITECRTIIAEQGSVIQTKHGLKDHPLLRHEATARSQIGRLLALLNLDMEPLNKTVGRPGSPLGWVPPR
jgi:hypothetical protein